MRQYFLVLGYGIPKNILKDENYGFYLKSVFNKIFDWCSTQSQWDPIIIFSGGKTDMFRPYRRTEAREMIRSFSSLTQRPAVKARVKGWSLIPETRSFSTLDNLIYTAEIRRSQKQNKTKIMVFGEQTRHKRILTLAKKVFGQATVVPIDFDQSANRYLDPVFIKHKESEVMKFDLWALENPSNLKEHRALFKKKFAFLRKAGPEKHVDAVKQWWEQELRELKKRTSLKTK
ncbi:MAG: ElyC/SanA/YdcF family protein [Patescibacteria group bacterium]